MDKELIKTLKNTLIYFIGNFGSKLLTFFLLPLYTFKLTKGEYGEFDLILSSGILLESLITFKLGEGLYRWFLINPNKKREIFSIVLIFITSLSICWFFLFWKINSFFNYRYFIGLGLFIVTSIYRNFYKQVLRSEKKIKEYSLSEVIYTAIFLILNIILVGHLNIGLKGVIISGIVSNISIFIFEFKLKFYRLYDGEASFKEIIPLLKFSMPIVFSTIMWWGVRFSDKYILVSFLGIESNGLYGVAVRLASIVLVFSSVFNLAWNETAIENFEKKEAGSVYNHILKSYFEIQLSLAIILICFLKIFSNYFLEQSYLEVWKYASILVLANLFQAFSGAYGGIFHGNGESKVMLNPVGLGLLINIVLNFIFVNKYKIYAISFSTFFSFLIMYIYLYMKTKEKFNIKVEVDKKFIFLLITSLLVVYASNDKIILGVYGVIVFLLVYIFNSKLLKKLIGVM